MLHILTLIIVDINCMGKNCAYKGQKMILFYIRNSYILRPKLPKTPIFLAKIILYPSYILGKTWLTAIGHHFRVLSKVYCCPDFIIVCLQSLYFKLFNKQENNVLLKK